MLISGIRNYDNLYNTKITDRVNATENAAKVNEPSIQPPKTREVENFDIGSETPQKEFKNTDDFASKYNASATYEMKGANSDITKLDETPSLSDNMKKQIFTQYEMFVGNASGISARNNQMAALRPTEDFAV